MATQLDKKEKDKKPSNQNQDSDDHETFGNEPPIKDPKPKNQPSEYEV